MKWLAVILVIITCLSCSKKDFACNCIGFNPSDGNFDVMHTVSASSRPKAEDKCEELEGEKGISHWSTCTLTE
jgi:hypothetical protein